MIARPAWERPLRRKLRKWRSRPAAPRWFKEHGILIVVFAGLQGMMVHEAPMLLGQGGGGTAASVFSGVTGGMLALFLRARWHNRPWLIRWTPATLAIARRLQTREALRAIAVTIFLSLLFAAVAACFSPATGMAETAGAAALALACGFLLAGGRISVLLLGFGVAWCIGYTSATGWLMKYHGDMTVRLLKGAVLGWMPLFPWSWATHGSPFAVIQGVLFTGALSISLVEWWKSWGEGLQIPAEREIAALSASDDTAEEDEPEESPGAEAVAEMHEEQRRNIRQHVAFAWFGMAGYLPEGPMPRLDRLLWRWLSPREKMLSCLGSHAAAGWFTRTRRVTAMLAVIVAGVWLLRFAEAMPAVETWVDRHFAWFATAISSLGIWAIITGMPGRWSRFQPWVDLVEAQGIGHFPTLALLPVTPGEWIRAAAKEWAVRGAWISSLWSIAIAAGFRGVAPEESVSWLIAFILLPWWIHAAWFPLSVMHRLIRAVSGPAFASHGITRIVPALVSGVLGLVATGVAVLTTGAASYGLSAGFLLLACLFGAFSLWMTLSRGKSMRLDVKPKPVS